MFPEDNDEPLAIQIKCSCAEDGVHSGYYKAKAGFDQNL
jgi:hypothetical protein